MSKQIITVFGATGRQGGSVAKALLQDGTYAVRAVTRNPDSAASKALAAQGAQLVQADLNDKDSVFKAVEGSYGVFGVTDFWTSFHGEVDQGKTIVDAAKAAGVKHFVWSTLEHSDVPHWETKAVVDDYLKASGVPRTSLYTAYFLENISQLMSLKRDDDGALLLDVPYATDGPLTSISSSDIGPVALAIFKNPQDYLNKDFKAGTETTTPREIATYIEEVVGEKVKIKETSMEQFEASKASAFLELWLNLKWFYDHPNERDYDLTRKVIGTPITTKDVVRAKGKENWLKI